LLGTGHHLNQLKKRDILPVDMSLLAGNSFEVHILDADMRLHFVADDRALQRRQHNGGARSAPERQSG
jgi:hypothetical protein